MIGLRRTAGSEKLTYCMPKLEEGLLVLVLIIYGHRRGRCKPVDHFGSMLLREEDDLPGNVALLPFLREPSAIITLDPDTERERERRTHIIIHKRPSQTPHHLRPLRNSHQNRPHIIAIITGPDRIVQNILQQHLRPLKRLREPKLRHSNTLRGTRRRRHPRVLHVLEEHRHPVRGLV